MVSANGILRRCSPAERKAIIRMSGGNAGTMPYRHAPVPAEPAIGSLDERLSIIAARLGARQRLPRIYDPADYRVAL